MSLPQMSFSGAVVIVVIVVVRALAIHKLPKRAFLVLWSVATARLLIPYSFPSAFSAYSLLDHFAPTAQAVKNTPAAPLTLTMPGNVMVPTPASTAETAAVSVDPWAVIWLIGALACAVFFATAYFKCRREFQASLSIDNEYARLWLSQHQIHRTIEIRQSDRISAPLTYGVFRPVILMPKTADWEDREALDYVLTHEYVHIRRFDAVRKLTLTAALCVHWFNPAVWMMYVLANRDIELSCDEAVIRRFGERTRSAYAMALIRMEEARSGLAPLSSNFSKNAIEERIIAIMEIKKTSLFSLIAAAALIVGVTAGFATSAKADDKPSHATFDFTPGAIDTAVQESTVISYVDPSDGKTYYSFDGGITFEAMTDEEYAARFPTPEVEWWTYEEFKEWLENEKTALQEMIGERAWTSGRGEFVWTQEIVDETVAMYEEILEDIKNGMLYSKTIDGDPDSSLTLSMNPADIWLDAREAPASEADFSEYEPYGLKWDGNEKVLYWNGQRVRYFFDGTELDGSGGRAIRLEYADAKLKGNIDVHAVRERVDNGDGSFDPFGPLVRLEKYSQAEFDARTFSAPALGAESTVAQSVEATYAFPELAEEAEELEELLKPYAPFGLSYEYDRAAGELSMRWQKKPVHSVYDPEKCIWIANNMYGLDLGPDAVDLEAVYKNGKLTGLRESEFQAVTEFGFAVEESTAEGNTAADTGMSFAERFEAYAPFGITYKEARGASGAGNVYHNGKLVSQFVDETPSGGVFSFTSARKGGIIVKTLYDNNGKLTGVGTIESAQEQKP